MKQKLLMTLCVVFVSACMSTKTSPVPAADNSMNSLDWPGKYAGVLPCADCQGIHTTLTLKKDLTYTISQSYNGKSETPITRSGSFSWNKVGSVVTLGGIDKNTTATMYQVGENQLFQLDLQGNRITGDMASKYNLAKLNTAIVNKYWKLIELGGQPFTMAAGDKRESHIILREKDNQFSGTGGCNNFVGSYQLLPGNRIRFSQNIANTLLPCSQENREAELIKVLQQADNYTMAGDTLLSLNKMRMAPLARFKVVHFN